MAVTIGVGMHADNRVCSRPGAGEHAIEKFLRICGDLIRITALPKKITLCAQQRSHPAGKQLVGQ